MSFEYLPAILLCLSMSKRYRKCLVAAISLGLLTSCGTRPISDLKCDRPLTQSAPLNNLKVDVYLDGTPSMAGYVSADNSHYIRTLDAMFNVLAQSTPLTLSGELDTQPAVSYLRLGENRSTSDLAQPLSGSDHLRAINPEFYNGSGFPALSVTQIDAAITTASPEAVTIVVTDLYQQDQYVNQVVENIKTRLATIPQGAVGLVGVRSEFSGTVYTEALRGAPSFKYDNSSPTHPFYILLIGRVDEVSFYMNALQKRLSEQGVESGVESVLFSPERLYKATPVFKRRGRSDFPEAVQQSVQVPAHKMSYGRLVRINLKDDAVQPLVLKGGSEALSIPFELAVDPIENIFQPSSLGMAFSRNHQSFDPRSRQFAPKENPALDEALGVTSSALGPNSLDFDLAIEPSEFRPPGIYFYTLDASVAPSGSNDSGLMETWGSWSSEATDTDGSKTHNLDNLLDGLAEMTLAKMRQNAISLGQYCYLVEAS